MSKENKGATHWLDYTRIMVDVNSVRWVNEEDALRKVHALEQRLAEVEKLLYERDQRIDQLKFQLAIAVEVLKEYVHDPYVFDYPDPDTYQDLNKPWRHYSGKRAREALKQIEELSE